MVDKTLIILSATFENLSERHIELLHSAVIPNVGLLEYSDEYLVGFNRKSGTGRNDITIKNVLTLKIAVILEIKSIGKNKYIVDFR